MCLLHSWRRPSWHSSRLVHCNMGIAGPARIRDVAWERCQGRMNTRVFAILVTLDSFIALLPSINVLHCTRKEHGAVIVPAARARRLARPELPKRLLALFGAHFP